MSVSSSYGLDPAIEAQIRQMGYVFNAETVGRSRTIFAERIDGSLPDGGRRENDVAYGAHERQRLDICSPPGAELPVLVFVPGGGLVGGDKSGYAHIPALFARRGFVGISMNYRLAPDHLFPAGAHDVAAVVDWVAENVSRYGGNPRRIFLLAQSAGAIHASSALFDRRMRAKHHEAIAAAVLMSGVYEITPDHEIDTINLYFGNDGEELRDRSPINHVGESDVPVIVTVSELEPAFFGLSAAALVHALTKRENRPAQMIWLKGHNHLSPVLNLGGAGDQLGPAIADTLHNIGIERTERVDELGPPPSDISVERRQGFD